MAPEDLQRLVEAIDQVRRARTLDEFPQIAMRAVNSLVRSEITSFNDVDPSTQRVIAEFEPDDPLFDGAFEVFARLQGEHPVICHITDTGDGSAHKISDFLDDASFHATALYQDFFGPLGLDYQMSITLPAALPRIIGIALNRSASTGDFDEHDRTLLNAFRPHLAQAYELVGLRAQLDAQRDLSGRLLTDVGAAAVLFADPPVELTPGALDQFRTAFGASDPDQLPSVVERWAIAQSTASSASADEQAIPPLEPLSGGTAGSRVLARFVPGGPSGDVIVIVTTKRAPTSEDLRRLGLSAREAEVMLAVMNGATNAAIGVRLTISAETVKKHLDRIYAKLGVRGRIKAAAFCLDRLADVTSTASTLEDWQAFSDRHTDLEDPEVLRRAWNEQP